MLGRVSCPLPHRLILLLTMYGQCTLHSRVGYGMQVKQKSRTGFLPCLDLNPEPLVRQSCTLTTRAPHTLGMKCMGPREKFGALSLVFEWRLKVWRLRLRLIRLFSLTYSSSVSSSRPVYCDSRTRV